MAAKTKKTQEIIFPACTIEKDLISIINTDKSSEKKKKARQSDNYYEGRHDILDYKIYYFDEKGDLVEDTTRSNIKISHPFFTELVDQRADYVLSKFEIKAKKESDTLLDEQLKYYFGAAFKKELHETEVGTAKIGWSYMYASLDKNFKTQFKNADGLGVIEVKDEATDETIYMIYIYIDRIDKGKTVVTRIEVNDKKQTFYYMLKGRQLTADPKKAINPQPHKMWKEEQKDGTQKLMYDEKGFDYIPFFRLDNNKRQTSDLKPIKAIIDDYDLHACSLSNNLVDFDFPIYAVKNYQGNDLGELMTNLRTKKTIGTGENGGLEVKTVDIPYEARQIKLELDERNIYRFGRGFNSLGEMADTANNSITAIKSKYTLLDLKCNRAAINLDSFLDPLIQIALNEINEENNTEYTLNDVEKVLEREMITNEKEKAEIEKIEAETKQIYINIILDTASYLPNETAIKEICEYLEIDYAEIESQVKEKIAANNPEQGIDNANQLLDSSNNKQETETPTV